MLRPGAEVRGAISAPRSLSPVLQRDPIIPSSDRPFSRRTKSDLHTSRLSTGLKRDGYPSRPAGRSGRELGLLKRRHNAWRVAMETGRADWLAGPSGGCPLHTAKREVVLVVDRVATTETEVQQSSLGFDYVLQNVEAGVGSY